MTRFRITNVLIALAMAIWPCVSYAFELAWTEDPNGNNISYGGYTSGNTTITVTYTLTLDSLFFDSEDIGDLSFLSASAAMAELLTDSSFNFSGQSLVLSQAAIALEGQVFGTVYNDNAVGSGDIQVGYTRSVGLTLGNLLDDSVVLNTEPIYIFAGDSVALDTVPMTLIGDEKIYDAPDILNYFMDGEMVVVQADFGEMYRRPPDSEVGPGIHESGIYSSGIITLSYQFEIVPEPGALSLLWLGGAALALRRPRRTEQDSTGGTAPILRKSSPQRHKPHVHSNTTISC